MNIEAGTPNVSFTIKGDTFNIPEPFKEGHTVSAGEAHVLNQVLRENVRNNVAKKIEDSKKAGADAKALQAIVDEYVGTYIFGERTSVGGGESRDPVTSEALRLAKAKLRDSAKAKGAKIDKDKLNEMAKQAIEQYPQFRQQAEAVIAARKAAGDSLADLLAA